MNYYHKIIFFLWIILVPFPVGYTFFKDIDNVENAVYEKEVSAQVVSYTRGSLGKSFYTKVFYNGRIYEFSRGRGDTHTPIGSNIYVSYNTKLDRVLSKKPNLTYKKSILALSIYLVMAIFAIYLLYREKKNPQEFIITHYTPIDYTPTEKIKVPNQKVRSWRKKRKMKRGG